MIRITTDNFNLSQICESGQCFRMRITDCNRDFDEFEILSGDRRLKAKQFRGFDVELDCGEEEYDLFWRTYFDIDTETDYDAIIKMTDPNDKYLSNAVKAGSGIRILRQDLWEMIVSFLISQQNNIPRIRKCINNICENYGEERDGFFAFPKPESLCDLPEDGLMPCNLGYRSKYVVRAAKSVVSGSLDLDLIRKMDYRDSKDALLKVFGIGEKVADCICLFALHHLEAFPIDTHIRQVLDREYSGIQKKGARSGFPFERYGSAAGVIQQYIFYYELIKDRDT